MSNNDTQKEQIAGLYHRVASVYGHIGPSIFAYVGQHLVEQMAMAGWNVSRMVLLEWREGRSFLNHVLLLAHFSRFSSC